MKILVGTLFSEVKDYAIRDWYKNVCSFTYTGFDFCAVDNSKDKKYHKKIFNYFSEHKKNSNINKITVLHTPRIDKDSEIFMAFSANELRRHFLKNDYDVLIYNECDVFPPHDIIERLLSYDKEIISALFFTGDKKTSYPMISDVNYYFNKTLIPLRGYLETFYNIGEVEIPKQVMSAGLGCALIYRNIIEQIPFKPDATLKFHHDTLFFKDVWEAGIENYYVPVMCRHENQTWDIQRKMIGN